MHLFFNTEQVPLMMHIFPVLSSKGYHMDNRTFATILQLTYFSSGATCASCTGPTFPRNGPNDPEIYSPHFTDHNTFHYTHLSEPFYPFTHSHMTMEAIQRLQPLRSNTFICYLALWFHFTGSYSSFILHLYQNGAQTHAIYPGYNAINCSVTLLTLIQRRQHTSELNICDSRATPCFPYHWISNYKTFGLLHFPACAAELEGTSNVKKKGNLKMFKLSARIKR